MTGRPDYDVGDLVVCVDDRNVRSSAGYPGQIRVGGVYRVASVALVDPGDFRVKLVGTIYSPKGYGYFASRFRKVDPLPETLTSLLASTPRERVTA